MGYGDAARDRVVLLRGRPQARHRGDRRGRQESGQEGRGASGARPTPSGGRHAVPSGGEVKRCSTCRQERPASPDFFPRDKNRCDGLYPICRECNQQVLKARRTQNLEAARAYDRDRYARNPEPYKRRVRARREMIVVAKPPRALRPVRTEEERLAAKRAEGVRRWLRHPDAVRTACAKWSKTHPELNRARAARRRAFLAGLPGSFTPSDILRLYEEQGGRCFYCGDDLRGGYQVDHKIPISRPELSPTNWPENLCCACRRCNARKHNLTAAEFLAKGLSHAA